MKVEYKDGAILIHGETAVEWDMIKTVRTMSWRKTGSNFGVITLSPVEPVTHDEHDEDPVMGDGTSGPSGPSYRRRPVRNTERQ